MYTQITTIKNFFFFSLQYIRMSEKKKKAPFIKIKEYIVLTILMLIIY